MNAGTDFKKAKKQAQANANQTRVTWQIWMYGGVYWIERVEAGPEGEMKIYDGASTVTPQKA